MVDDAARKRLGRGLAALIGDVGAEAPAHERVRGQRRVPIEFVKANPRNPRRIFSDAELDELANSIRERGIIQPIVVRSVRNAPDHFEIIAGERRWRAAQRAGLHDVPVTIVDVSDAEALELAIIENVQRADLDAVEEAMGYQALIDQFKHAQEDVARIVGKSRSHVANTLRLLKLSDKIKNHLHAGDLTAGHARMLVGHPNADSLADDIIARGLNVRQVEALMRPDDKPAKTPKPQNIEKKSADTVALEKRLSDALGMQVSVDHRGEGGAVRVSYRDLDQLDEVVKRLERGG